MPNLSKVFYLKLPIPNYLDIIKFYFKNIILKELITIYIITLFNLIFIKY